MCGCNSNFNGEVENFSNYDGDFDSENGLLDFDGDVENFDEEFDNLLTKKGRKRRKKRRKLRKEYKKQGMSRKEARKTARKEALAQVPRGKAKSMAKAEKTGESSAEAQVLKAKGLLSDNPAKASAQISEAVAENTMDGSQRSGKSAGSTPPEEAKKGGMGKTLLIVGVVAVVGFIAFRMMKGKKKK
jgi:cobalamin biosynthesis Mg chelatase CobN